MQQVEIEVWLTNSRYAVLTRRLLHDFRFELLHFASKLKKEEDVKVELSSELVAASGSSSY